MFCQWGGGLHRGGTDVAHLAANAFIDISKGMRRSLALMFVDIASAFASMARMLVISDATPDEHWIAILVSAGFSPAEIDDIKSSIISHCALAEGGCSEHTTALLGDIHRMTWFAMEACPGGCLH